MIVLEILFWLCLAAMVHTYLLYPLTLRLLPKRYKAPEEMSEEALPTVAVLTAAYNEERVIAQKIRNGLALDYPPEKLEILIGSDGSTDRTNEIAREFDDPRVRLIELAGRNGKIGVINQLVEQTSAEILLLTDADIELHPAAVRQLVKHYADPEVAVVGGRHMVEGGGPASSEYTENLNYTLACRIKHLESQAGGVSGMLGSINSMRRSLYRPYSPGSTNDDTVPSILAVLEGKRAAFEPEAIAYERGSSSVGAEFRRRIRIGAGNFQTLLRYRKILSPRYGVAAYTFFSHKVLRWIFPLLMIALLALNLLLWDVPFYRGALLVQGVCYGLALLGGLFAALKLRIPVVSMLWHFLALNFGLLCGLFVYMKGIRSSAWEPTERVASHR